MNMKQLFDNQIVQWDTLTDAQKRTLIDYHVMNKLLDESNWTQLPDAPLTQAQKAEWQLYREALQVIEFTYPNPDDTVFPDAPVFTPSPTDTDTLAFRATRETIRAEYNSALDTLAQIESATSPTNAQVVTAVRFMARTMAKILKLLSKII